jgi:four helix bundle protein
MRTHRDLLAWRRAQRLTIEVHRYAALQWKPAWSAIFDQLKRAALSVQLNIAEGFASGPGARCRYHLRIAYGSAVETTELIELLETLGGPDIAAVRQMSGTSREAQALTLLLWKRSRR